MFQNLLQRGRQIKKNEKKKVFTSTIAQGVPRIFFYLNKEDINLCIERFYIHITHKGKVKVFRNIISGLGQQNLSSVNTYTNTVHIYLICLVFRISETEKYLYMLDVIGTGVHLTVNLI